MKSRNDFTGDSQGEKDWKEYCKYHFASLALQGIIADPHHNLTPELAANAATRFANALLAELEKQPEP